MHGRYPRLHLAQRMFDAVQPRKTPSNVQPMVTSANGSPPKCCHQLLLYAMQEERAYPSASAAGADPPPAEPSVRVAEGGSRDTRQASLHP